MKKLTKANLSLLKIHNEHNYANGRPYLTYYPEDKGRGGRSATWRIIDPKHKYPGYWQDYGAISFVVVLPSVDKKRVFEEAVEKFKELYSFTALERTPFGSWMDADFVAQRNAELLQALTQF